MAPLDAEQDVYECPSCEGYGYVVVSKDTENEIVQDTDDCNECLGIGFVRRRNHELP